MHSQPLLLLVLLLLTACGSESDERELFVPDEQYSEFTLDDGRTFRLTAVRNALNTSIFYYSEKDGFANGFVNRSSTDGRISAGLNFNPRLLAFNFDGGVFRPDLLEYPYLIPFSNFQLSIIRGTNQEFYDFTGVDVYLDSWQDGIATGRFSQSFPSIGTDTVYVTDGAFRVLLQTVGL